MKALIAPEVQQSRIEAYSIIGQAVSRMSDKDDEVDAYRRHLESLMESRRWMIRRDGKWAALLSAFFGVAFLMTARAAGHNHVILVNFFAVAFGLAFAVVLFWSATETFDWFYRRMGK